MRPVTGSSPSPGCRAANGRAFAPPTPSNGSMKSSSAGSKPRPCCRLPRPQRCCSGHCSPRVRSPCAKSTGGRPSPRNSLTSRLTSLPDPISSPLPETALIKFQHKSRRHRCLVLQVINSSPGDLTPVFDAILEKAHNLCAVEYGTLQLYDGKKFRVPARRGFPEKVGQSWRDPYSVEPNSPLWALLEGEPLAEIPDVIAYQAEAPNPRAEAAIAVGIRSVLFLPLRRDNLLLGVISAGRKEAKPFQAKEIALLQNFAAQAVIAMENARLLTETREALEQQTATSEVLEVINSSPGSLAPVFEAMLAKAMRLCEASFGLLRTFDGEYFHLAAAKHVPAALEELWRGPTKPAPGGAQERLVQGEPFVHLTDPRDDEGYRLGAATSRVLADVAGARTYLTVPLRQDGRLLGSFAIYRQEVRPFSDKQIALLQNFAA